MGFLTILKILYSYILPIFSSIKTVKDHPIRNSIIAGALVLALGGVYVKHEFNQEAQAKALLVQQKEVLEKEKLQLKADVQTAVAANVANNDAINELLVKQDADKRHMEELASVQTITVKKIEVIRQNITNSKPQDDGPVAKVLADTVEAIQNNREKK